MPRTGLGGFSTWRPGAVIRAGGWRGRAYQNVCAEWTHTRPPVVYTSAVTDQPLESPDVAFADPGPGRRTNSIGHPVERMLNASARDILDALENGFRARADLKGKLAELFAARYLDGLQMRGVIDRYEWQDLDGEPDFIVWLRGGPAITVEAKNIRSGKGSLRAETQKTRASKSDPMSRYYRADQFDVLAVCMYNQTGEWNYIFARIGDLRRLATDDRYLEVIQVIPQPLGAPWTTDMADLL